MLSIQNDIDAYVLPLKKKTTTTTPLAFGFSKILKFYYAGTAMVFTREPANVCDNLDVSQLC